MKKIHSTLLSCAVLVALASPACATAIGMSVEGTVTPQADKFLYEYTVTVGGDFVTLPDDGSSALLGPVSSVIVSEFMLPFFDTGPDTIDPCSISAPGNWAGAMQSPAPAGWSYLPADDPDSETYGIDPCLFVDPPAVLVFSTSTPFVDGVGVNGSVLGGFSFISDYGWGNGPTVLVIENNAFGEPTTQSLFIDPPIVISPGHPLFVPEPVTLFVMAVGGLPILLRRRRSRG